MHVTSPEDLVAIYRRTKVIAVVGASADESKPAWRIPRYLQEQGYRIVPVNPKGGELFGEPVVTSLREVDGPVDVVDVFRPPSAAQSVAEDAIAIGAGVLWFQPGTSTEAAVAMASDAGLDVVSEQCMGAMHQRLGLAQA